MQVFGQKRFMGEGGIALQGLFQTIAGINKIFHAKTQRNFFSIPKSNKSFAALREQKIFTRRRKGFVNFGNA